MICRREDRHAAAADWHVEVDCVMLDEVGRGGAGPGNSREGKLAISWDREARRRSPRRRTADHHAGDENASCGGDGRILSAIHHQHASRWDRSTAARCGCVRSWNTSITSRSSRAGKCSAAYRRARPSRHPMSGARLHERVAQPALEQQRRQGRGADGRELPRARLRSVFGHVSPPTFDARLTARARLIERPR